MKTKRSKKRQVHRERRRQCKPPWFEKLRVMAEYGSSGIWVIQPVGGWRHSMIEHGDLRLPLELSLRFERWIETYTDAYIQRLEDPVYVFDHEAFNAEGRALAQVLKRHVGSTIYVELQSETAEGGLNPPEEITVDDD